MLRPGKPTDNATTESFNSRLRQEYLNEHWFLSSADAQEKLDAWRIDYNENRPYSSLGKPDTGGIRTVPVEPVPAGAIRPHLGPDGLKTLIQVGTGSGASPADLELSLKVDQEREHPMGVVCDTKTVPKNVAGQGDWSTSSGGSVSNAEHALR